MNNSIFKKTQNLLKKYGLKPSKKLGQNFLVDEDILAEIVKIADVKKDDFVLEVGPGLGILTKELAVKAKQVAAVEKDSKMRGALIDSLAPYPNVQLINADILEFLADFTEKKYKVVANIPYYLTSQLIRQLLEKENQPSEITLLIQKEVAERICAAPPQMSSILAVSVQFYGEPSIELAVPGTSFFPVPAVDSAVLKICNIQKDKFAVDKEKFFRVVKAGFSAKRKILISNLSKELKIDKEILSNIFKKTGIDLKTRAEALKIEDWVKLVNEL